MRRRGHIHTYEENELSHFKGGLTAGTGLGLLSEVVSTTWYHRKRVLSADQMLENIKTSFLEKDVIEGAWISLEREPIRKFIVRSSAYRGGLSRIENDETVYYEFLASAHTGAALDISRKKGAVN